MTITTCDETVKLVVEKMQILQKFNIAEWWGFATMVELASKWRNVPLQHICQSAVMKTDMQVLPLVLQPLQTHLEGGKSICPYFSQLKTLVTSRIYRQTDYRRGGTYQH